MYVSFHLSTPWFSNRRSCPCDLTEHHAIKTYWGMEVLLHALWTSALDRVEWSNSRPDSFIPREKDSGTHWMGSWVGRRAGLDTVVKKKFPAPAGTRTPAHQSVAQRYTTELDIDFIATNDGFS
jgi:hypothetical protein